MGWQNKNMHASKIGKYSLCQNPKVSFEIWPENLSSFGRMKDKNKDNFKWTVIRKKSYYQISFFIEKQVKQYNTEE